MLPRANREQNRTPPPGRRGPPARRRSRNPIRGCLPFSILLGLLLLLPSSAHAYGSVTFPCPADIELRVEFWVQVFSHYSGSDRVLHDSRYPWVVYEVWDASNLDQPTIKKHIDRRKRYYDALLEQLAIKDVSRYTLEEKRVAALFESVPETAKFTRARERIRSQPGVREQMQKGLMRSGRYIERIEAVLDSAGVPRELACLPHVESSFNPEARSKVGAVGLWQFTHDTGRRFLRIENDLDERMDPYLATEAAAQYLLRAREVLESWPLAVVSYNHGIGGMARAKEKLGTTDIGRILLEYDGPSFGFASQNFYCEFLAVVEISSDPVRYFGAEVSIDPPHLVDEFRLPQFVKIDPLMDALRVTRNELADLNPALGQSYIQGSRALPRGYRLRLPYGRVATPEQDFCNIPLNQRFDELPRTVGYRVRAGDTLAEIARKHRVSVVELKKMNQIRDSNRLQVGQVLVLPDAAFPAR